MKPLTQSGQRNLVLAIIATAFGVGIFSLLIYLSTFLGPGKPNKNYIVTQDTYGSMSISDFLHGYEAASAGEREAFAQMVEAGRLYIVPSGTRVGWDGNSPHGIAVCYVSSGRLTSKVLFIRADMLRETRP